MAHKPRDANRLYRKGRDLSEQEKFEEAVIAFNQALQMDPANALALNARGYARLRMRQYEPAIADFSEAIRLNAEYANAYRNRSVARHALGDQNGAREDNRRAAELERGAQVSVLRPVPRP